MTRTQAIDEAVRRVPRIEIEALGYHASLLSRDPVDRFESCIDCQQRANWVRSEFSRIMRENMAVTVTAVHPWPAALGRKL